MKEREFIFAHMTNPITLEKNAPLNNYYVPLFVPFNIRNNMIHDIQTDIDQIKPQNQYQTLLSYMKEKEILNGLIKRRNDIMKRKLRKHEIQS